MQVQSKTGDYGNAPANPSQPAAPAAPADSGPGLDEERAALEELRKQLASLTEQVGERERALKEKAAREAERRSLVDAYEKAAARWRDELDATKARIAQELRMAETAVKDQLPAIDAIVKAASERATRADADAATAQAAWKRLLDEQSALDAAAERAQTAHAAATGRPKAIETSLKDLKTLTDQAAKAEAANTYPAMYFLLSEASALAGGIDIPTAQQYEKDVRDAAQALDAAKGDAAKHKKLLEPAKADAGAKAKAAEAARSARRADVLDKLKSLPVAAASTASAR